MCVYVYKYIWMCILHKKYCLKWIQAFTLLICLLAAHFCMCTHLFNLFAIIIYIPLLKTTHVVINIHMCIRVLQYIYTYIQTYIFTKYLLYAWVGGCSPLCFVDFSLHLQLVCRSLICTRFGYFLSVLIQVFFLPYNRVLILVTCWAL